MQKCRHCGVSVLSDEAFCCAGCEAVFAALHQGGLQQWYVLRARDPSAKPVPAVQRDRDDLEPLDLLLDSIGAPGNGSVALSLGVEGMTCAACAWLIESVAARHDALLSARVRVSDRAIDLRVASGGRLSGFARELGRFGYSLRPVGAIDEPITAGRRSSRQALAAMAMAGALAANAMMLAIPSYAGLAQGWYAALFAWLGAALATASLMGPGRPLLMRALAAVRGRVLTLDVPLAMGLIAAWSLSAHRLLGGDFSGLYFDSLTGLIFTILVGRYVRDRAVDGATRSAALLASRLPMRVAVWRRDHYELVAPAAIVVGDQLRIGPGASLPCPATATAATRVDLAVVTGELEPRAVGPGAMLPSGARAVDVAITAVATGPASGRDAALRSRKSDRVALADRASPWFTGFVLLAAAAGAVAWAPNGLETAASVAMTVLLVACPCAFALATPLVHARSIAALAVDGLLLREPDALERAASVRYALLDKTGTLTTGRPLVTSEVWWCGGRERAAVERTAAAVQSSSPHPLAQALTRHLLRRRADAKAPLLDDFAPRPAEVSAVDGGGLIGRWQGREILMTGRAGLDAAAVKVTAAQRAVITAIEHRGGSVVAIATVGEAVEVVGVLGLEDTLRHGIEAAISAFSRHGLAPHLLSGDHAQAVRNMSEAVGIPIAMAAATPTDKGTVVDRLGANACMVVGDGRNDVPAMRKAAVAITLASADPTAIAAADVVLSDTGLPGLAGFLDRAAAARRATRLGLGWALAYNLLGISLALCGLITPLLAALLMPLSSLSVLALTTFALPISRNFAPPVESARGGPSFRAAKHADASRAGTKRGGFPAVASSEP